MIATPLPAELAQQVADVDARVRLLYDPSVLPPSRWTGDVTGDPGFERDPAAERRWNELLSGADVLYGIPGNTGSGLVEVLRAAPRVRWVQARNAGAGEQVGDALALEPGLLRDIAVTSVSGIHAGPLAEFALLGLLAFAKRLPELERDKASRSWPEVKPTMRLLAGRTALVVGLGAIGMAFARLAGALEMHVLGVKRVAEDVPGIDLVATPDRLPELARRADALVVTLPLTEHTRGLVDRATLAALPPGAVVVNVGRGAVVDEQALVERLQDGTLKGAALDVFAEEPLPLDSPLWGLENVILTPHDIALVEAEEPRIVELFIDNLRRRRAGEPLRNALDPEVLY
jgi:glyoxylate/hydroxypyruvate reductase